MTFRYLWFFFERELQISLCRQKLMILVPVRFLANRHIRWVIDDLREIRPRGQKGNFCPNGVLQFPLHCISCAISAFGVCSFEKF